MCNAPPRLLLITVSAPGIRRVRRSRVLNFQQITMPYLAAFVPDHWAVRHIDEEVEPVDPGACADVVALTFHTPSAPHAYRLAASFRKHGVTVVLGGPHVTLMPDEAREHADVVVVGEAETTWPRFLADYESGTHQRRYASPPPFLDHAPLSRKELFHRKDHTAGVLFATRGCPHRCAFCALPVMYPGGVRRRPVADVAGEYRSFRGRIVIFWDDNIAADTDYAKELFRAITPHRKWWSSQAGIEAAEDDEFLELAARSGCKQLFIGMESISQESLDSVSKGFNRVERYERAIRRIHAHGISVQAGIVFGFDSDGVAIFDETLDFLEGCGVQNATFNILTPYPGTPLFRQLEAEGRLLTRDWERYNGREDVVFRPRQMSPEELLSGYRRAVRRFYSPRSICKRLSRSSVQLWWTLPLNCAYALALRQR